MIRLGMHFEEKSVPRALGDGAGLVRYVRLSERDRGAPGSFDIDWKSLMTALMGARSDADRAVESFVATMPQLAGALSFWLPVARDRAEILDVGPPFLGSLARATGLLPDPA